MQTASQSVEHEPIHINIIDDGKSLTVPSSSDHAGGLRPAKRPTRQWAAWTREEEESFFTALRQVGKNFEKITCRVQSKNKDQVRHYYYRLVRRMNKLLGPSLCLDAKNSKDTNAAMLRWWSLLEKYSCKASKLHLKPRRFKLFIEALEHQLVKDRKKNVRKRSPQGEICSSPTTSPTQNKLCAIDVRAVKTVLPDSQNVQKGGQGKGSTTRRNLSMGVSRSISKEESSPTKPTRQRRRSGTVSAAAIKRWEKAAIAGVSLVADAAEHLERTAGGKEDYRRGGLNVLSVQAVGCSTEKIDSSPVEVQPHLPDLSKSVGIENYIQHTVKLKLQLFPIDESTRKTLEADKHNPHLELTLGTRKKISSILEHLDRKWGSSSAASGELMLFPFIIQRENLLTYQRWTRDSVATAAEVYAMSGSPPVFRLRYGWILSSELQTAMSEAFQATAEKNRLEKHNILFSSKHQTSEFHNLSVKQPVAAVTGEMNKNVDGDPHKNDLESFSAASSLPPNRTQSCDVSVTRRTENAVDQEIRDTPTSAGEWADSLTNVSVGDLLTDVPEKMDASCVDTPVFGSSQCLGEMPFTCDSFDAAIAAHISNQNKMDLSGLSLHSSSIWDAEETCDAFSFQKRDVVNNLVTATVAFDELTKSASAGNKLQHLQEKAMVEDSVRGDPMDEFPSEPETENSAKDFSSLTDIYWPDSLGPLELDVPSCRYYSEDLILSDSLTGLNRLIASSLDAFQNCPFFGLDEKGPSSSGAGSQGGVSFAGKTATGGSGAQSLQA